MRVRMGWGRNERLESEKGLVCGKHCCSALNLSLTSGEA